MRLGHVRGLACAKTKKFPYIFLASPPPTSPPRSGKRNGKEIFGFASPFQSLKRALLFYHISIALFYALTATEAHQYPRLVVALNFVASTEGGDNSLKRDCAGTNKSICACPTRPVRAQIPAVFEEHSKTAGIAPLDTQTNSNYFSNNSLLLRNLCQFRFFSSNEMFSQHQSTNFRAVDFVLS